MHNYQVSVIFCVLSFSAQVFSNCVFNCDLQKPANKYGVKRINYRSILHSHTWTYMEDDTGPKQWDKLYKTCKGDFQSPVNIDTRTTLKSDILEPIEFVDYEEFLEDPIVQNNGHTAQIIPKKSDSPSPFIRGGGLGGTFSFRQLHFHWGSTDLEGSEHTIDGRQYPLEAHIVHEDLKEATNGRHKYAVIAILLELSEKVNSFMDPVVDALKNIINPEMVAPVLKKIRLRSFLPNNTKHYYRYMGSLTTPPCTEGVVWTIYAESLQVTKHQLQEFRKLHLISEELNSSFNFRSTQELHGRMILESEPN